MTTEEIPVPEGETCRSKVYRTGGWGYNTCDRKAKLAVKDDSGMIRYYCRIHDPEKVKERRAKSKARFDAKWDAEMRRIQCADAASDLARCLAALPDDDLKALPRKARDAIQKWRENSEMVN